MALLAGANSGLGLAMADGLARAGADVVIWGRREEVNAQAAKALRAHGTRIAHRAVDVSDEQEVVDAFAAAVAELGRVAGVVRFPLRRANWWNCPLLPRFQVAFPTICTMST